MVAREFPLGKDLPNMNTFCDWHLLIAQNQQQHIYLALKINTFLHSPFYLPFKQHCDMMVQSVHKERVATYLYEQELWLAARNSKRQ